MNVAREQEWTLEELAGRVEQELRKLGLAGTARDGRVSALPDARTVRYYTSLGLVDRPRTRGRRARYRRIHLLQLLAVKCLQAAGLRLADVQARLYGLTADELEVLIASFRERAADRREPDGGAGQGLPVVREVLKREVHIAPGLVLSAESGFSPAVDREALISRLEAALDALGVPPAADRGDRMTQSGARGDL
jgi:DNA-binding transcriptional MerR regulator